MFEKSLTKAVVRLLMKEGPMHEGDITQELFESEEAFRRADGHTFEIDPTMLHDTLCERDEVVMDDSGRWHLTDVAPELLS